MVERPDNDGRGRTCRLGVAGDNCFELPVKLCSRNHPYTEANTRWYAHSVTGKTYRTCRACHALRSRLRYRNDAAHREKEKARCLSRYQPKDQHA